MRDNVVLGTDRLPCPFGIRPPVEPVRLLWRTSGSELSVQQMVWSTLPSSCMLPMNRGS
jgi:hypothetical protein